MASSKAEASGSTLIIFVITLSGSGSRARDGAAASVIVPGGLHQEHPRVVRRLMQWKRRCCSWGTAPTVNMQALCAS
jgi:hypothetical protein